MREFEVGLKPNIGRAKSNPDDVYVDERKSGLA